MTIRQIAELCESLLPHMIFIGCLIGAVAGIIYGMTRFVSNESDVGERAFAIFSGMMCGFLFGGIAGALSPFLIVLVPAFFLCLGLAKLVVKKEQ